MADEFDKAYREMTGCKQRWQRVNDEPYEYAIYQGQNGDTFVKLLDGTCLRRRIDEQ